MAKVMVVCAPGRGEALLRELLGEAGHTVAFVAADAASALALVPMEGIDLAVINAPVQGGSAAELASKLAAATLSGIVVMVRSEDAALYGSELDESGAFWVEKPLKKPMFEQALRGALATRRRLSMLSSKAENLQHKLDELKVVNRAKLVLMQYLSMTEEQAHRFIEKQAMDMRLSRLEVAKRLIANYVS